jgi:hypothetical protein
MSQDRIFDFSSYKDSDLIGGIPKKELQEIKDNVKPSDEYSDTLLISQDSFNKFEALDIIKKGLNVCFCSENDSVPYFLRVRDQETYEWFIFFGADPDITHYNLNSILLNPFKLSPFMLDKHWDVFQDSILHPTFKYGTQITELSMDMYNVLLSRGVDIDNIERISFMYEWKNTYRIIANYIDSSYDVEFGNEYNAALEFISKVKPNLKKVVEVDAYGKKTKVPSNLWYIYRFLNRIEINDKRRVGFINKYERIFGAFDKNEVSSSGDNIFLFVPLIKEDNRVSAVKYLIEIGVDPHLKNKKGFSFEDWVMANAKETGAIQKILKALPVSEINLSNKAEEKLTKNPTGQVLKPISESNSCSKVLLSEKCNIINEYHNNPFYQEYLSSNGYSNPKEIKTYIEEIFKSTHMICNSEKSSIYVNPQDLLLSAVSEVKIINNNRFALIENPIVYTSRLKEEVTLSSLSGESNLLFVNAKPVKLEPKGENSKPGSVKVFESCDLILINPLCVNDLDATTIEIASFGNSDNHLKLSRNFVESLSQIRVYSDLTFKGKETFIGLDHSARLFGWGYLKNKVYGINHLDYDEMVDKPSLLKDNVAMLSNSTRMTAYYDKEYTLTGYGKLAYETMEVLKLAHIERYALRLENKPFQIALTSDDYFVLDRQNYLKNMRIDMYRTFLRNQTPEDEFEFENVLEDVVKIVSGEHYAYALDKNGNVYYVLDCDSYPGPKKIKDILMFENQVYLIGKDNVLYEYNTGQGSGYELSENEIEEKLVPLVNDVCYLLFDNRKIICLKIDGSIWTLEI